MSLIFNIAAVASGVLLALSTLDKWDGEKDFFKKAGDFLFPYDTIIGGILLVVGILGLLQRGCLIQDLVAIAGGLLLLINMVGKAPGIGNYLLKASNAMMPFKVGIGLVLLVVGLTNILGFGLLC